MDPIGFALRQRVDGLLARSRDLVANSRRACAESTEMCRQSRIAAAILTTLAERGAERIAAEDGSAPG